MSETTSRHSEGGGMVPSRTAARYRPAAHEAWGCIREGDEGEEDE
jgi:hypothetical protein